MRLHEFMSIFFIFEENFSRPARLTLYYLKINLMITLSALFAQQFSPVESILVSIICALVLGIPLAIISVLFKVQNRVVKWFAVLLSIGVLAVCVYVSLVNAAIMGLDLSNQWAVTYISTYITDTFMMVCYWGGDDYIFAHLVDY